MAGPVSMTDVPQTKGAMLPELMAVADLARGVGTASDAAAIGGPIPSGQPGGPINPPVTPPMAGTPVPMPAVGGGAPPMPAVPGLAEAPPALGGRGFQPGGAPGSAAAMVRKPLTPAQWAAVYRPEEARKPTLDRAIIERMQKQYDQYLKTDLATQTLQQTAARTDSYTARGRKGKGTGYQGKNDVPLPPELIEAARKAIIARQYDHPAVEQLKLFYGIAAKASGVQGADPLDALESAAAAEILAEIHDGPYLEAFNSLKAPGSAMPRSVSRVLSGLIGGLDLTVQDVIGGQPSKKGKGADVRDWLYTRNVLTSVARTGTLHDQRAVQQMLAERAPTPQQVIQARDDGDITPEQAAELMEFVLSPAEIAALGRLQQEQEQKKPKVRSFRKPRNETGHPLD